MDGLVQTKQGLIDFCRENELYITSIAFKYRHRRKFIWRSANGASKNIIGYILISRGWKSSVVDIVSVPGEYFDFNHKLLMSKLKLMLKHPSRRQKFLDSNRNFSANEKETYTNSLSTKLPDILSTSGPLTTLEETDQLDKRSTSAMLETTNGILGRKAYDITCIVEDIIQLCNQKQSYDKKADKRSRYTSPINVKIIKIIIINVRKVEQEVRKELRSQVTEKSEISEIQFKKGNRHELFKIFRELSTRKTPSITQI